MLRRYLLISRPRFWMYLFGPFLIGLIAAPGVVVSWRLLLLGLFFTYPANLLVYGFNDIFDHETDKHNPKKQGYERLLAPENRQPLLRQLIVWGLLGMTLVLPASIPLVTKWAMTAFYFFGIGYSAPPIRAKTKPLIDALFNILYIFPGVVSYSLLTGRWPDVQLLVAATLWCMAMHAYSAVPDIEADSKVGIKTIATQLSGRSTLLFCAVCYAGAALLSWPYLKTFSFIAGGLYVGLMVYSISRVGNKSIFPVYKAFPYINMVVGAALFFYVSART